MIVFGAAGIETAQARRTFVLAYKILIDRKMTAAGTAKNGF